MPPAKKRKTQRVEEPAPAPEESPAQAPPSPEQATAAAPAKQASEETPSDTNATAAPAPAEPAPVSTSSSSSSADRLARFKALKARAKESSEENFKAATKEAQRATVDPSQLPALQRKHAVASHKLLKADVEEAGGDFERKRAWDWTVDESEAWDRRLKKKAGRRDENAFAGYASEAGKVYKRQLRANMAAPDLERYQKDKMRAIERAAASGGLDIVETEDGELIAVDKDGTFYSTEDSTTFAENRPDKAAVDRLVEDLRRAEEQRLKKRRERMAKDGDDGDVTYINEKNKQFNQKLARFYDKYTSDLRDSFERGTMI